MRALHRRSPAILLVDLPTWEGLVSPRAAMIHRRWVRRLASHYGLPYVSMHELVTQSLDASLVSPSKLAAWERVRSGGWLQCGDINSTKCRKEAAPHPNTLGHELVALSVARLLQRAWKAPPHAPAAGNGTSIPAPLMQRAQGAFASSMFGGRWHSASVTTTKVPNYELAAEVCIGPEQLGRQVKPSSYGWAKVEEGSKLHPKPGYVPTQKVNELSLCYPVAHVCGDATRCTG